jgi:hypothetical protein
VPDALQAVVMHCLEKDRTRRFQNVSELGRALAPFGSRATSRSVERISKILGAPSAAEPMPASVPQAQTARYEPTQSNWGQTNPSRSSAGPLIAAGAAAIVVLGSIAGFFVWRSKSSTTEAAASAGSAQDPSILASPSAAPIAAPAVSTAPLASSPQPADVSNPKPVPALHASPAKPVAAAKPVANVPLIPAPDSVAPPAPKAKRSTDDLLSGRN